MGECNTILSDYTTYMHLKSYCTHPSIYLSSACAYNLIESKILWFGIELIKVYPECQPISDLICLLAKNKMWMCRFLELSLHETVGHVHGF